jgi:hypothetical protein
LPQSVVIKDLGIFFTMTRFVHPLLLLIAKFTNKELAQVVEDLLAENRCLRSKLPKRIEVMPAERASSSSWGSHSVRSSRALSLSFPVALSFAGRTWKSRNRNQPSQGVPGSQRTAGKETCELPAVELTRKEPPRETAVSESEPKRLGRQLLFVVLPVV